MDERKVTLSLPEDLTPKKTETINGQPIPRGTVDEFARAAFGKPFEDVKPKPGLERAGIVLAIRKYKTTTKFYRLIWQGRGQEWLAAEDDKPYSTRTPAIAAGYELAARLGAFFIEGL